MSALVDLGRRAWRKVRGNPVKVQPLHPIDKEGAGKGLRTSLWHQFVKPPYGGGNQFMLALKAAFLAEGATVYDNKLRDDVVHLCNSTWFDVPRFEEFQRRTKAPMVHRIDGPITLYRGTDRALDDEVFGINARVATATVLQSEWSAARIRELGYSPVRPTIIRNAVDNRVFHTRGRVAWDPSRKIRLISTAWSDNARKGGPTYRWLQENLDESRFEYTFVGRIQETFTKGKIIPALPSEELANVLRQQDIYVVASRNEPCSNGLLEALSCGLPVLYLDEGSHPELVGDGGLPFKTHDDMLGQLDRLVDRYQHYQSNIKVQSLEDVGRQYLEVLRKASA